MAKEGFNFSIPVKVVLTAGMAYLVVWAAGLALAWAGLVNYSHPVGKMTLGELYVIFEIVVAAAAAAAGIYHFLERPLANLRETVKRASEGDFLIRAPVDSDDELGALAHDFNQVLYRVTDISANRIQADQDVIMAQEQLKLRQRLEEKSAIIERTNKTLEQLVTDLSLIYDIGQEVNTVIDLDELYAKITEALKKHLRINELAVLLYDDKREELQVKAAYGFDDVKSILHTTFRTGEGITGLVAETGKKIYIKDTSREARFLHYKGDKASSPSSFLSIPLVYKDDVMGVINFGRKGAGSFSFQDAKMLSLVAGQVALAIANARLYTRTRELSVTDELIGINNRRYFQQMLQMEWKRAVRFRRDLSLVIIDIDHFKAYNDAFGHIQGDLALKRIGTLFKQNLREVDTVARFGGEEFVLLLPDTDKRGAVAVAEKVRGLVEGHRFLTEDHRDTRPITISAGIATYPDDVAEMDDLINFADIALYRAKEKGRNRSECYAPPAQGKAGDEIPEPKAEESRPDDTDEPQSIQ